MRSRFRASTNICPGCSWRNHWTGALALKPEGSLNSLDLTISPSTKGRLATLKMDFMPCLLKSFWRICYAVKLLYIPDISQKLLSNSPKRLRITIIIMLGCARCSKSNKLTMTTSGVFLCSSCVTKCITMPLKRILKKFIGYFSAIK